MKVQAKAFVRRFRKEMEADRIDDVAAMMTYYAVFALFPMLSLRIHEHCAANSVSLPFTQDTPAINWPPNLNRPSYVTLGANTGVIVYSGLNFTGQQRTFTSNTNFCSVAYPNGAGVNDNVLSLQLFYIP